MSANNRFGMVLKELRRLRGLTQDDLALITGRSVDAISQWERGINSPSFDAVVRLCDALNVSVTTFLDGSEREVSDDRSRSETEARLLLEGLSDTDLEIAIEQIRALSRRQ